MIRLSCSLIAAALLPCFALAGFTGFPLATSTNAGNWYEAQDLYQPVAQLYSGVVERCEFSGVAVPSIVETWTVSAGSSNNIVTNGLPAATNVYTNIVLLTDEITTTNQIGPFEYEYTDPSGTYTSTAYPYVTRAFMNALDTKINALIPYYLDGSVVTNGNWNSYFGIMSTNMPRSKSDEVYYELLRASKAGIFDREGIGTVRSTSTNDGGYVTGGLAYYTRQPATARNWLLSELHASTNDWQFVDVGGFDTRMYETNMVPVIQYIQGGTNALATTSITLSGLALTHSNQTTYTTSEVVFVSSTTTVCALPWYDITNITTEAAINNTGDVFAVSYTNEIVLYGNRPYRLHATDLDERWVVLKNLTWIEHDVPYPHTTNAWPRYHATNYWYSGLGREPTAAAARAEAEAVWASPGVGPSYPRKTGYIIYDSTEFRAQIVNNNSELRLTDVPTNAVADVQVYFAAVSPGYDGATNNSAGWYAYGTDLLRDQTSLFANFTDNTSATLETELLWPQGLPIWPSDPDDLYERFSVGCVIQRVSVALDVQFQFR